MLRLLILLSLSALVLSAQPAPGKAKAGPPPALAKIAWLAGSWRMERAGRVVEEQWMPPAGGAMLGMGRTLAKGRMVEYEFNQIREGPGGELFFVAQPSGQKSATFKILSLADTTVVFENKEHDFPQTVGYVLQADGSLLAYIEGPGPEGTTKRVEFSYQRVQP